MQYLPLTLFLIGALVLSMAFSHLQHRYYLREVNRIAARYNKSGYVLSSGIARGRLRGAVAILVVDREAERIECVMVMEGSSVLARFHECRDLRGRLLSDTDIGPPSRIAQRAIADAMSRFHRFSTEDGATEDRQHGSELAPAPDAASV